MSFYLNKLSTIVLISVVSLSSCTDAQKESAKQTQEEASAALEKAKNKTVDFAEDTSDGAAKMLGEAKENMADSYDAAKEKSAELLEDSKEKAAELKVKTAEKLKEACIATKKKMNLDPKDCE